MEQTHSDKRAGTRWTVRQTSLGPVRITASDLGITGIELGYSGPAPSSAEDPELAAWVDRTVEMIESPTEPAELPLDVEGTSFQRRVWAAIAEIPPGTTRTYQWVAGRIGRPDAARAVGAACAANPVAVAIPCHRVVAGDGRLTGYRWGLERKQALLEREAEG